MPDKLAVVTGGTGGLGGAVVAVLLEDGWGVHVPWTDPGAAERLRADCGGHPALTLREADLTDPASVASFFAEVGGGPGALRLLCNLVGGWAGGTVEETEPTTLRRMLDLNVTTTFLATRAAAPLLREAGGGTVVNVAASAAVGGAQGGMSAYVAAKSAVVSLTRTLAEELAPDSVTVNAVAPTTIDTPANRAAAPDADRATWLAPEEMAAVIRFLAGPDARIVSGNVLRLTRG